MTFLMTYCSSERRRGTLPGWFTSEIISPYASDPNDSGCNQDWPWGLAPYSRSIFNTAMKADWGTSTVPIAFMRFLPAACFFSSFFLREMSPP